MIPLQPSPPSVESSARPTDPWALQALRRLARWEVLSVRWLARWAVRLIVLAIRMYQRFISPLRPPTCRYYPSCSAYAVTALERHGPIRGTWLAARRLLRCHPWSPGGVDHVPDRTAPAADRAAP